MGKKYDFGGYATRINLKCGDGRTIRKDAFKDDDGRRVPLVWQHQHDDPGNVIGHADLENRSDGVYAYCSLNNTEKGKNAREIISHGDVQALSIYANHLKQRGSDVFHGMIREVSLVIAGANPGAFIEQVAIQHGDGDLEYLDDEVVIYGGSELDLERMISHADDTEDESDNGGREETIGDVFNTLSEKQKKVVYALIGSILEDQKKGGSKNEEAVKHADESDDENSGETVQEVFDTLTEKQKNVVYAIIGTIMEDKGSSDNEAKHSDMEDDEDMGIVMHNVFDRTDKNTNSNTFLSHSDWNAIVSDAKACGSLRTAYLAHADDMTNGEAGRTYGIGNLDLMFPEYRNVRDQPDVIKQDDAWVAGVIAGVNKTPFARIRTNTIDITADVARARGYKKGHLKKEEVVKMARRVTGPTTIYKKQKLDRDDIIDLEGSGFDAVVFLKSEMQGKLREELARAILIGDGRSDADEDKIDESCIRPILHEDEFYAYEVELDMTGDTDNDIYESVVDQVPLAMLDYKGSGSPTLFTSAKHHTKMRMLKDKVGRKIYMTESDLAGTLGVGSIVDVPYFDNLFDEDGREILGVIVNLKDYTVGTNRGGQTTFFDDFDLDYNQFKYLYETRLSGALTRPDSAIILKASVKAPIKVGFEIPDDVDTFTELGDMTANEIQSDVTFTENEGFAGTLHYVDSWTEFSGDPKLQSGNFFAVKIENEGTDTRAKIYAGLTNGLVPGLKQVTDGELVVRVTDELKQKLKVKVVGSDGKAVVRVYNLAGLNLEPKAH